MSGGIAWDTVLKETSTVRSFLRCLISNFYSSGSGALASSAAAPSAFAAASPSAAPSAASFFASSYLGAAAGLVPPEVLIGIFSSSVQISVNSTRSNSGIMLILFLTRMQSLVVQPSTSALVRLPRPTSYYAIVVGRPARSSASSL